MTSVIWQSKNSDAKLADPTGWPRGLKKPVVSSTGIAGAVLLVEWDVVENVAIDVESDATKEELCSVSIGRMEDPLQEVSILVLCDWQSIQLRLLGIWSVHRESWSWEGKGRMKYCQQYWEGGICLQVCCCLYCQWQVLQLRVCIGVCWWVWVIVQQQKKQIEAKVNILDLLLLPWVVDSKNHPSICSVQCWVDHRIM